MIPKLVGKVQFAFMGDRNIQDGVLVANEIVEAWRKRKRKGIIIKFDFEKAYDNINWQYLLGMMQRLGFP